MNNKLWESHRLIIPEMREKAIRKCKECYFFVRIQGKNENRWGCAACIEKYATLNYRVPQVIPATEILKLVGREGLYRVLKRANPDGQACSLFRPALTPRSFFPKTSK